MAIKKAPKPTKRRCENCGRVFLATKRKPSDTAKKYLPHREYCSQACLKALLRKEHPTYETKRSKAELLLESMIRSEFPSVNLLTNDRFILESALELDFYFPDLRLGIEINGPSHVSPIFGKKAYEAQRRNDESKRQECVRRSIVLHIVDISKAKTWEDTEKIITAFFIGVLRKRLG